MPGFNVTATGRRTLEFHNVRANDLTDSFTIRVASVNGTNAATAARNGILQIRAIPKNEFDMNSRSRFSSGRLTSLSDTDRTTNLAIPSTIWGEPVTFISWGWGYSSLTSVIIPNSVRTIEGSFSYNRQLTGITIGANVTIDNYSFDDNFRQFYAQNNRRAGRYTYSNNRWNYSP